MKLRWLVPGVLLATVSGWALAQRAPESLLPPGFDNPPPAAAPAPAPASAPASSPASRGGAASAPRSASPVSPAGTAPGIGAIDGVTGGGPVAAVPPELLKRLPTVVQVVNTQDGAVATGTTVLPWDDTIPQNTEGDQYMSLSITPTNASNKLILGDSKRT